MWKKSEPEEPISQPHSASQPAPTPRSSAAMPRERAVIGPSIEVRGDLVGGEDLHIEGKVEGKIDLRRHNVSIGKNGRVQADIFGRVISVEGEIQGNLHGEEQIILKQSSTVRGNLTAPRVTLEDGSNFKGSIDMTPKESAAQGAAAAKTSGVAGAGTAAAPAARPGS